MSKKTNRARRRYTTPRLSATQRVQPSADNPQPGPAPTARPTVAAVRDLREEYRYVASDLKRVAIIAAVMLLVMGVLAILLL